MCRVFFIVVQTLLLVCPSVYGAVLTWTGSTTEKADFNEPSNWDLNQVPASTDSLTLSSTGGKYTGNIALAEGGTLTIQEPDDSSVNYFSIFYNDFTMTGGTVNFNTKRVLAGIGGTDCEWNISGGEFNYTHDVGSKNGTFRFGVAWTTGVGNEKIIPTETPSKASSQTLNISGDGTQFNAARFILGYVSGTQNYKQTVNMNVSDSATVTLGGNAGTEYSYIGRGNANLEANLTLNDSATFTGGGDFIVGWDYGLGTITLNDSSKFKTTAGNLTVGSNSTKANKITVGGTSTLEITNGIILGSVSGTTMTGTGTLEVSGGTAKANWINVSANGASLAGTGTLNVTAGKLNVSGNLNVYKKGTLAVSGGTGSTIGTLNVNDGGNVTISGGTDSSIGTLNLYEGGTVSISGGTSKVSGTLKINGSTNSEMLTVTGGSLDVAKQIQIGFTTKNTNGKLVVNGGSLSTDYLQIANPATCSGEVELKSGTISTTQGVRIGRNGAGTLTISGGELKVGTAGNEEKALILAYEGTASSGTLTMTGGTINTTTNTASAINIGRQGTGTANVSQAEGKTTLIKTSNVYLGDFAGAQGSWTQSGGTLQTYNLYIGNNGTGEFTLNGGEVKSQVDGGNLNLYVGNNSSGTYSQTAGTLTATKTYIGNGTKGDGIATLSGGTLQSTEIYVGNSGKGSLTQTSGSVTATTTYVGVNKTGSLSISGEGTTYTGTNMTLGQNVGSTGSLHVSDSATLTLTNGTLQVGNRGNGTLSVSGATVTGNNLYLGYYINGATPTGTFGSGSLTAENSTLNFATNIYVGTVGNGEAVLKNCTTTAKYFCMGWNANATQSVATIEGGSLTVSTNLRLGLNAPATLNIVGDAEIKAANTSSRSDSKINFIMQDGKLGNLDVGNILTDGGRGLYGTVTTDCNGLQFTTGSTSWELMAKTGSLALKDSEYFTLSKDGTKIVAKVNTESGLPEDGSTRGLTFLDDSPTEMAFYTGLWNYDARLDGFVDWLNSTNSSLKATPLDRLLGSVSVTVPANAEYMLWNFASSPIPAVYSTTPVLPEPSTWALLLVGLLTLRFARKRK